MNSSKHEYLVTLRSDSAYPVYRATIGLIALLGYLLAAINGFASLIAGFGFMRNSVMLGLLIIIGGGVLAALTFFLFRLFKEAALIVADMGDSTVDVNAKTTIAR